MKQKFAPTWLRQKSKKYFQLAVSGFKYLFIHINLWVIEFRSGILTPPFLTGFIKALRLTLSLPFQTKENNRLLIFLINSFLLHMSVSLYKIFGRANDFIISTLPINVKPLQPHPFSKFLSDFFNL